MIGIACPDRQAQPPKGDRVTEAIRGVFSSAHAEREAAKKELLGFGRTAVPQLLELLRDLPVLEDARDNLHSLSREGRGENVEALIRKYFGYSDSGQQKLALSIALSAEVAWRLREDVFELLGLIGDEEAVPLLIQIMQDNEMFTKLANFSGEMKALARIGSPAVPMLIEAVETAESRASSLPYAKSQPTEGLRALFVRGEVAKVRARVARVLGEIGDARALPVLEKLLEPDARSRSTGAERDYVQEAIERILTGKNSGVIRN